VEGRKVSGAERRSQLGFTQAVIPAQQDYHRLWPSTTYTSVLIIRLPGSPVNFHQVINGLLSRRGKGLRRGVAGGPSTGGAFPSAFSRFAA
jgi:hypothetical protein